MSPEFDLDEAGSWIVYTDSFHYRSPQIIAHKLVNGRKILVSSVDGIYPSDRAAHNPRISADGTHVFFISESTDLVDGVQGTQIYRKSLEDVAEPPTLMSSDSGDVADFWRGQITGFELARENSQLVFTATQASSGDPATQVYWKSSFDSAAELASTAGPAETDRAQGGAWDAVVDPGGNTLLFSSCALNFTTGPRNPPCQVYKKDVSSLQNPPELVSSIDGNWPTAGTSFSETPRINRTGSLAGFSTYASNLVPGLVCQESSGAAFTQVLLKDLSSRLSAPPEIVSADGVVPVTSQSDARSLPVGFDHEDHVYFLSSSSTFPGASQGLSQLYKRGHVVDGEAPIELISTRDGTQAGAADGTVYDAVVSGDGQRVLYLTDASNLVASSATFKLVLQTLDHATPPRLIFEY